MTASRVAEHYVLEAEFGRLPLALDASEPLAVLAARIADTVPFADARRIAEEALVAAISEARRSGSERNR